MRGSASGQGGCSCSRVLCPTYDAVVRGILVVAPDSRGLDGIDAGVV
jgi:hypothetical protein